jgi:hypothetical protein
MNLDPARSPNRILLANQPRLLRGLLRRVIQKDPALQVVGEVMDQSGLPAAIDRTGAQWVILSFPPQGRLPWITNVLKTRFPSVQILALATDGSRVRVERRSDPEGTEKDLIDLSLLDLLGMLRRGFPVHSDK